MPITHPTRQRCVLALALACLVGFGAISRMGATETAAVGVVTATPWSPNDVARDGAQEFAVLLRLAALQREHPLAGLVGVADKQGSFQTGEERALRFAALSGVPVLKISATGNIAHCPDELFIEAGALPPAEACRLLAQALERNGAPPRAQNPTVPTADELAAIVQHVQRLREDIVLNRGGKVTVN